MPAAIGPLGPLLAEPARARSEPAQSGRGTAFAEVLETEGRSDQASSEDDGEHADGAGNAAVLAFSSQPRAAEEDTATEIAKADLEPDRAASDPAALAPAPAAAAAAPANEAESEPAPSFSDKPVQPSGDVKVDDVAAKTKTAANVEIASTDSVAEVKSEGRAVQAGAVPADAPRPIAETEITSTETASDGRVRGTASDAAAQRTETSEVDVAKVAEFKAGKVATSDAMTDARAEIRGGEAPGRPDLVLASLNPGAQMTERGTGRLKDVPATASPATVSAAGIDPEATPQIDRAGTQPAITPAPPASDSVAESSAFLSGGLEVSAQATAPSDSGQQAPTLSLAAGAPASAPVAAQAPAAGATGFGAMMTPAQATIVAAPQEIVDIVSSKLAGGDKPDRIMVQLDPPELGRVSIEFKFDAQGLQQVAVRADTPEAMKQLRLLHFDLVQSLEQHGLSARDMTFSEGSANGSQNQQASEFIDYTAVADIEAETIPAPALLQARRAPITIGASGLNIKL
ncbi:hypothetical protein D1224_05420 [Henriciella barbarensis]|uniref:Flagellar hook-length control protein-like C-terminal domain-containing protein n=1 Tax=Henriciella barbarensis TaxID=86342 RepID=A0A399QYU1_9PROT|nr:flagellar hook-length control protein FliK [Henriciella barbarensis]RIJ23701.1 hypothetical protein D1224_05420 [Henriciella barbarensis]